MNFAPVFRAPSRKLRRAPSILTAAQNMISNPDDPTYDPWLDRWSALFDEYRGPALDLGCGPGFDTQCLTSWEFAVTATDISPVALAVSEQRNPGVKHVL